MEPRPESALQKRAEDAIAAAGQRTLDAGNDPYHYKGIDLRG